MISISLLILIFSSWCDIVITFSFTYVTIVFSSIGIFLTAALSALFVKTDTLLLSGTFFYPTSIYVVFFYFFVYFCIFVGKWVFKVRCWSYSPFCFPLLVSFIAICSVTDWVQYFSEVYFPSPQCAASSASGLWNSSAAVLSFTSFNLLSIKTGCQSLSHGLLLLLM